MTAWSLHELQILVQWCIIKMQAIWLSLCPLLQPATHVQYTIGIKQATTIKVSLGKEDGKYITIRRSHWARIARVPNLLGDQVPQTRRWEIFLYPFFSVDPALPSGRSLLADCSSGPHWKKPLERMQSTVVRVQRSQRSSSHCRLASSWLSMGFEQAESCVGQACRRFVD